jgi:hypothetical protein
MLIQEEEKPMLKRLVPKRPALRNSRNSLLSLLQRLSLMLLCALSLCVTIALPAYCFTNEYGRVDENRERAQRDAEKVLQDVGASISIEDADVVRIGASYAVDQDEVVAGDVVIIGGALTVEGTIEGDAAVIGGSMYLSSTARVEGDAVVIGGILETEEGATVVGKIVENPEQSVDLENLGEIGETGNVRIADETDIDEADREAREHERQVRIGEGSGISVTDDDVVKLGEDIEVGPGEVVDGDVVTVGSDIIIEGTVLGDVVATSGDVELGENAKVSGDVVSVFGDVEVAEGADVGGDIVKVDLSGKHVIIKGTATSDVATDAQRKAEEKAQLKAETQAKMAGWGKTVRYRISLNRPDAQDVRLTGSFVNWDPEGVRMTVDEEGTWSTYYDFPMGTHLYKFIVDGEAMPDPDEPDLMVDDGMGGYATKLMVIPPKSEMVAIRFSLFRPQAEDVRVTGSFNNWDEKGIPMIKDEEGTWAVTVPIAPGKCTYKFYIDGEWGPDPDVVERVEDGKGGWATPFEVKSQKSKISFDITAGSKGEEKGTNFTPAIDYNRVDGFYLAGLIRNKTNVFPLPRFFVEGGRSWQRDRWLYLVEIEQPLLAPFALSVGGSFYDKTDTYDKEIISDDENFVSSSFVKRDYRDYFDRRGAGAFLAFRPLAKSTIKVGYASDEYRPLRTRAHRAIFRHDSEFAPNPHNPTMDSPFEDENFYQICYDPLTGEQACDKIKIKAVTASCELDLRNCTDCPTRGILVRLEGEWTGDELGSDLAYSRYVADLRLYNTISDKQKYAIRLKAGGMATPDDGACGCTPDPQYFFPKQFYVGGIGTLPGYDYKEFRGTHMVLMNFEYAYALKGSMSLLFFADGGDATGQGESTADVIDAMKINFDAGIAFRVETASEHVLTFGVAKRLDDSEEPMLVTMRATRPF